MFDTFNVNIKQRLKVKDRTYNGVKPNPEDWADLMEMDPDFNKEFNKTFSDPNIDEADSSTPKVLEDTYLGMELAQSRNDAGP